MSDERAAELERALDEGSGAPMPDNVAPGILGERPVDIRKVDTFQYEQNAGLVQETTAMVSWLWIVLLYLLVITAPVALWLLWREPAWTTKRKAMATGLMAVGYALLIWQML